MTIKQKIENIENKIKKHEYDFFVLGEATISRAEMEMLKVELHNLKLIEVAQSKPVSTANEGLFEFYDGI